ncbi:hypothetical protein BTR23_21530 [Alkalihalophilus pseudofirmus]|uniref:DUF1189 domain-containing protein n=1 Tax=Alkalihalobacterium alkalinitrilicum TaxID=427920 RepID=UPI00094CE72B|nr:DUF1189 domain-containing protein [Alkalihalobacterium alkalinitrilicum]OLO26951.1 hypothetical protein BTR23_21530 [Alkalihalophilus pseudofirmus]
MNIFKQLIRSLYSPKDIAIFRFQGIGKTIFYVFLLMAIISIPNAVSISTTTYQGVNYLATSLQEEIPDFALQNGVLTSDFSSPYIDGDESNFFILDSTGELTVNDIYQYDNGLALLEREAVIMTDGIAETIRYRDFGNLNLTKAEISSLVTSIADVLPIILSIILLLLYIFITALKFIGITVLALIGLVFKNKAGLNLKYRHLWILSAYTVTLPTAFFALTESFGIFIPFSMFFYWAIAIFMLYRVLQYVPKPTPRNSADISSPPTTE